MNIPQSETMNLATELFFPSPSLPPKSFVKAKMEICIQPAAAICSCDFTVWDSVNGMQIMERASHFLRSSYLALLPLFRQLTYAGCTACTNMLLYMGLDK